MEQTKLEENIDSTKRVINIICGPTASGKTDFAHKIALENNGEIINGDSMQQYIELPILTASPSNELKKEIPYHLYNYQSVRDEISAKIYVNRACEAINKITKKGRTPIIAGGTGMYISMLVNGYSEIPEISPETRSHVRNLIKSKGSEKLHSELVAFDSRFLMKLNKSDKQRISRAYEVWLETDKSIITFQEQKNIIPLPNFNFNITIISPSRDILYKACNERFIKIFNNGAIDEVKFVLDNFGELGTTGMKALGSNEIIRFIKGEISKQTAIELAQIKTRQYAKRQQAWFKNQEFNSAL